MQCVCMLFRTRSQCFLHHHIGGRPPWGGEPQSKDSPSSPTVVAVRLVLMLGVGEGQHRVGAAGQAGTPPRGFTQTPAAPQPHGALWRHHGLTVGVYVLGGAHREAVVREAHLGAEGQAAARWWLADAQLAKTEMLTWRRNTL